MKRLLLCLSVLIIGLVSLSKINVRANEVDSQESMTINFNHQNNLNEESCFSVYLLTQEEYKEAMTQSVEISVEKTTDFLATRKKEVIKEFNVNYSKTAIFDLSKYTDDGANAYYVIVQNQSSSGDKFIETLPNYISFDQLSGLRLSIETKPVTLATSPYFFKYSSGLKQEPLENAEFAFYKINAMNEKEHLVSLEPIQWKKISNKKEVWHFKSDKQGLVELPYLHLTEGTYYFEETKAPVGFLITAESKKIPLIMSKESNNKIQMTVNGEVIQPHHAGQLSQQVMKEAVPKVFNKPKESSQPPSKGNYLPKTGESLFAFSSLGLIMMFVSIKLMKRGKENE